MYFILITLYVLLVLFDQLTKQFMYNISDGNIGYSINILGDFLKFTYVENHGGIFGLFQGSIIAFTIISTLLIIYLLYTETKNFLNTNIINKIGVIFIASGATGNMIDRYLRGFVIDMIDFRGIWSFVFNVADAYIHIGIYILAIYYLLSNYVFKKTKGE